MSWWWLNIWTTSVGSDQDVFPNVLVLIPRGRNVKKQTAPSFDSLQILITEASTDPKLKSFSLEWILKNNDVIVMFSRVWTFKSSQQNWINWTRLCSSSRSHLSLHTFIQRDHTASHILSYFPTRLNLLSVASFNTFHKETADEEMSGTSRYAAASVIYLYLVSFLFSRAGNEAFPSSYGWDLWPRRLLIS